jgi:hypothetical protein
MAGEALDHHIGNVLCGFPVFDQRCTVDLMNCLCGRIPVDPARLRGDQVFRGTAVLEDPGNLDRIAALAEGRCLEIQKYPHLSSCISGL